mmetsp:Transcript_38601/g.115891  ORF Transcript_38601/g.115891 Transcript_38601/m.115891 type:complete len:237 (+) Transcript_38601:793-1503(+)
MSSIFFGALGLLSLAKYSSLPFTPLVSVPADTPATEDDDADDINRYIAPPTIIRSSSAQTIHRQILWFLALRIRSRSKSFCDWSSSKTAMASLTEAGIEKEGYSRELRLLGGLVCLLFAFSCDGGRRGAGECSTFSSLNGVVWRSEEDGSLTSANASRTEGGMRKERLGAATLGGNFGLAGLSCDGAPLFPPAYPPLTTANASRTEGDTKNERRGALYFKPFVALSRVILRRFSTL